MENQIEWIALYKDGSHIKQIEEDGSKNSYHDIDREKLVTFTLHLDNQPIFMVDFEDGDGKDLIWRRRVQMIPGAGRITVHIVGKKKRYVAVVREGLVMMFNNFNESNALLNSPELFPEEK